MTLSPPDLATPAQPPTDGVRELLAFAALTVATYLVGALVLVTIFGSSGW